MKRAATVGRVTGNLRDLHSAPLADLLAAGELDGQLARVLRRVDQPGTSISGYNGAGGSLVADDGSGGD